MKIKKCRSCGEKVGIEDDCPPEDVIVTCPECGGDLDDAPMIDP